MTRLLIVMILSRSLCHAAGAPGVSQKHIDEIAKYWQSVLRLTDWHISVSLVGIDDLPEHSAAVGRWDHDLHVGAIRVLQPADYAEAATRGWMPPLRGQAILRDIEDSIVHELIHLRLHDFREAYEDPRRTAEEYTGVRL